MRSLRNLSIIVCLLVLSQALGFDVPANIDRSLLLVSECKDFLGRNCGPLSPPIKRAIEACQISAKAHECENISRTSPDLKELIINCRPEEFCKQQTLPAGDLALKCWDGVKGGVLDPFTSLGTAIKEAWEKSQKNRAENKVFLDACEKSLPCKRDLIKNVPYYASLPDPQLNEYRASRLQSIADSEKMLTQTAQKNYASYLPQSASSPAKNPEAQKRKLGELWASAQNAVQDKYPQYACYSPEAQQELTCYVFASLLDPTLVVGKGMKLYKAAKIIKAVEKKTAANKAVLTKALNRKEFTNAYLHFSPTTTDQNLQWMALAEKTSASNNIKFFDVENSVMKELNDTIKDKNLVTSLTNYHKALLDDKTKALFNELKKDHPDLELLSYSDFKASRFAFKGQAPPDLDKRLNQILQETNQDFSDYVHKNNIIKKTDQPETWFRAGYGETADQATLASRFSRQSPENSLKNYSSAEMKSALTKKIHQTEALRSKLQGELAATSVLTGGTKKTLSEDAIDILRKNGNDLEKSRADLKNRFGLSELSTRTVETMQSYVKSVDEFSPGIHIAQREVATLDGAAFGGLSADMTGMGSKNLGATAKALSESKSLDEALLQTRQAEQFVTAEFQKQKKAFQTVLKDVVGEKRINTICSGDDCIAIPKQALSEPEKRQILQKLSEAGYSSKFRLSFIPENITDVSARNQLSVHGESIEKALRKNLADKIEPNKLKGLTFGVDMKTTKLNQGEVNLMTAAHAEIRLTTSEQKLIHENFKKALQQLNNELQSQGKSSHYQAWSP